jgi:hypothetical protein
MEYTESAHRYGEDFTMLTDRLHKAIDRAATLPEGTQDAIAEALEQLLRSYEQRPPELRSELSAVVEQSMRDNAATLEYLKDK